MKDVHWSNRQTDRQTYLYTLDEMLELGTDERRSCVGGIDVQPDGLLLTDESEFLQVVERAHRRRAQSRRHVERN